MLEDLVHRRAHTEMQGLVTEARRTGTLSNKMPSQDGYFFFWREMLPFLPHTFVP
jgi:hypothetical protein